MGARLPDCVGWLAGVLAVGTKSWVREVGGMGGIWEWGSWFAERWGAWGGGLVDGLCVGGVAVLGFMLLMLSTVP